MPTKRQSHRTRSIPQYMPGLREAIEKAWPNGVVEPVYEEESYLQDILPRLTRALQKLPRTRPLYECEAEGKVIAETRLSDDPWDDPVQEFDNSRSYHLFFVSPARKMVEYGCETEEPIGEYDDDEFEYTPLAELEPLPTRTIKGVGWYGWCVAVSHVAPFAVATVRSHETYDDGSISEPALYSYIEDNQGKPVPRRDLLLRTPNGEKTLQSLDLLLAKIQGIIESHDIIMIPEEESRKPVPWLRADGDVLAGFMDEPLTVLDAFFFETV